jgi:hypothetical protein
LLPEGFSEEPPAILLVKKFTIRGLTTGGIPTVRGGFDHEAKLAEFTSCGPVSKTVQHPFGTLTA